MPTVLIEDTEIKFKNIAASCDDFWKPDQAVHGARVLSVARHLRRSEIAVTLRTDLSCWYFCDR